MVKEKDFRRVELPGRYIAKLLYGWKDRRFDECLKKLERNWIRWKEKNKKTEKIIWGEKKVKPTSSSRSRNLKGRIISEMQSLDASFFI